MRVAAIGNGHEIAFLLEGIIGEDGNVCAFYRLEHVARNRNALGSEARERGPGTGTTYTPRVKFRTRKPVRPYKIVK